MRMRALLFLAILPLAAPAHAETWDCSVSTRCVTGESCFDLFDPGMLNLTVAKDGKSLSLKGGGEEGTMRRIDTTATSSTFFDRIDPQTIGFLTLFHDGTLTLSSHDASNGTTAATASSGICKKAAD